MSAAAERLASLLDRGGIAVKPGTVFVGERSGTLHFKVRSRETAERAVLVLKAAGFDVRYLRSDDYAKVNRGTVLRPTRVEAWLVGGKVAPA